MISKNKKGAYAFKIKSATGDMGRPTAPVMTASQPMGTSTPSAPEKLSATYSDGYITVSNGNSYSVTKSGTPGGWPSPHVIMKAPVGAKITISYDDTSEKYNSEVPFEYTVQDYNNNNSYFRLTVDEGGPDKTWYVRLQNGTGYQLTIE
jgi:hypothetical protein